jgi:large subunit ribosomal protein L28
MSKRCDICGKEPSFGMAVSRLGKNAVHRRIKGRSARRFNPNIQVVKTVVGKTPMRQRVCTSCLKKGKVQRRTAASS